MKIRRTRVNIPHFHLFAIMSTLAITCSPIAAGQNSGERKVPSNGAIVDALVRDGQISGACVRQEPSKAGLVRVQSVDLNSDGALEYLVEGLKNCACGAQKCDYWVYANKGNSLKLLMAAQADRVEVGRAYTNGYRDLVVTYIYKGDAGMTTLRFNGTSYTDTPRIRK